MVKIIHAPIVQSSFSGDHCLGGNAITRGAIILGSNSPGGHLSRGSICLGGNCPGAIICGQLSGGIAWWWAIILGGKCPGQQLSGGNCPRTITILSIRHRRFYRKNTYPYAIIRSSHRRFSVRKGVLRNFAKFTAKHLCQRSILIKLQASGLQLY